MVAASVRAAGARALAGMHGAELLRKLDLSRNEVGADGVCALVASAKLDQLRGVTELNLANNKLGPAGVENLLLDVLPRPLANLKRLDISGNGIGSRGVRALLGAKHLDGLLSLDVSGNKLDEYDRRRLRQRFGARVRV